MAQMRALQSKERQRSYYSEINSLSPIDQLAAEIKIEIFYNALLDSRADKGRRVTPFFLGKICRSWRDFVWSSPILWTNLHLHLSKDRYKAQTSLLRDWLSRTAKYPLCFRLTTGDLRKTWISDSPIEILTIFVSVSAQWREVEFFLPNSRDCYDAISMAENSLPLLTAATVRLGSTEQQLNLFSMAPQLSALHLHHPYLFKVVAPWHQLREFTSHGCRVDEIRGFLNEAPNIIRCSFKGIVSRILDDSPDPDIFDQIPVLQHLEYLELWFGPVDIELTQILQGPVKLPSLREISLRGPFDASMDILHPIMTSFHSSHLLETFNFGGVITSDYDLIQVLEYVPSIKELCLDFIDQNPVDELFTMELLSRLYSPDSTEIILPNLRSFTYRGPTSLNEDIDLFLEMLVYRFRRSALQPTEFDSEGRAICQIQSVTVASSSEMVDTTDIQEELNSLVQEGLELSLLNAFILPYSL